MQQAIFFGILINSALYIAGCFTAGLVFGVPLAWKLALATAGICYAAYTSQQASVSPKLSEAGANVVHGASIVLVLASIVTGVAAGLPLLFR